MTTRPKDLPKIRNPPSGEGHRISYRDMTSSEVAEYEALQRGHKAMLARQAAYEKQRWAKVERTPLVITGSVFAKSCALPNGIIDYNNPNGFVPPDLIKQYGDLMWLGARSPDASGTLPLKQIGSSAIPAAMGRLALGGSAVSSAGAVGGTVGAALLTGIVALLWPSSLGDSALYSEDQLRNLKQARSRMRLSIEQQADGSLKGYGFYTGQNRAWEMVDVIQLTPRADQYVADLGDGIELIWTPAIDPSDTLGIPALEAAPQTPHIWIYPPTPVADSILVNPIYPPEYKDFILVFPVDSGVRPVYVVLSTAHHDYVTKPDLLPAFPSAKWAPPKTRMKGGGLRPRWRDKDKFIYEWDFQHGAVEKYNKRGKHLGEFDHVTGAQKKPANPERWIEP
ncbi:S-type pyocin domain-containing protein [Pseudomonas sp. R1-15]|uniref:S-type pyocin domain-containing protein n=1 Tax=Pseudomonas sp. R1-15 TaxID=2817399 RepID=UPI003DAA1537